MMALIYDGVCCALCRKKIDLDLPYFASCAMDEDGQGYSQYADAPIHWQCLWSWDRVEGFLDRVYHVRIECFALEYWTVMEKNNDFCVATNGINVRVDIARTGLAWDVPVAQWPEGLRTTLQESPDVPCLPADRQAFATQTVKNIIKSNLKVKKRSTDNLLHRILGRVFQSKKR